MEVVIVVLLVVLIVGVLVRPAITVATIRDYQRGLRYRQGRLVGLLDPGTHLAIRPFTEIHVLDGRPTSITASSSITKSYDGSILESSAVMPTSMPASR